MLREHKETSATIRRASRDDFEALYGLWMQDHINPFMSFELISQDEFKPIFEKLFSDSEIYVIEEAGKVVAARRMDYGTDDHAHLAEFASFGVDKDHLRKGYGKLFYDFFIAKIKKERADITRIEISQETDNDPALYLALKQGFKVEATFPDWLTRTTGTHKEKWYVGERFLACLLNSNIKVKSQLVQLPPELPALKQSSGEVKLEVKENKASGYLNGKIQATCSLSSGVRRYDHIQFWNLQLESDCDPLVAQIILRELAVNASCQCKKIEIFTSDQNTLNILSKLGFHCRGEKIASRKIGNEYFNEVGVDLSFFNIEDALRMLKTISEIEAYKRVQVSSLLTSCQTKIQAEFKEGNIDEYACLYLENIAFQMTREGLTVTRLYDEKNAPWAALVQQLTLPPFFRHSYPANLHCASNFSGAINPM
jgi:GNAT superfamily N-acetyltransferase